MSSGHCRSNVTKNHPYAIFFRTSTLVIAHLVINVCSKNGNWIFFGFMMVPSSVFICQNTITSLSTQMENLYPYS